MAGRIYSLTGDTGERDGRRCKVYTRHGGKLKFVKRVEFDGDESAGWALVTMYPTDEGGNPLITENGDVCECAVRLNVRVEEPEEADAPVIVGGEHGLL